MRAGFCWPDSEKMSSKMRMNLNPKENPMYSDEIRSIMAALGVLAGKIGEEEWALVRMARHNLSELADRVQETESKLTVCVNEE